MADSAVEEKLTGIEIPLAKLEGTVEARKKDLPARLDRLELKIDRIPSFILAPLDDHYIGPDRGIVF